MVNLFKTLYTVILVKYITMIFILKLKIYKSSLVYIVNLSFELN